MEVSDGNDDGKMEELGRELILGIGVGLEDEKLLEGMTGMMALMWSLRG